MNKTTEQDDGTKEAQALIDWMERATYEQIWEHPAFNSDHQELAFCVPSKPFNEPKVIDNWGIDDEIDALVTSCLVSDYPHKRMEVLVEAGATNVCVFVGERDSFGPVTMVMQGEYNGKRFDILD